MCTYRQQGNAPAVTLRAGEMAQDLGVACAMTAKRDDGICLRIGNTAPCELEKGRFAHADILEASQRSPRKHRLTRGAMARNFENDCVRQAREPHCLKVSRAHI